MALGWNRSSIHCAILTLVLATALLFAVPRAQAPAREPSLDEVMQRVAEYVAGYGEKASLIVATETYTQQMWAETGSSFKPRKVLAEFAIVRAAGSIGWIGFRDVVEVNGERVVDRKDRLQKLLSDPSGDAGEVTRISNESARYNIGPISRNFNVPTTMLFFLHSATQSRFEFSRTGTKTIDGTPTIEIGFKETHRPTLIMTREGKDVPCEGSVWVVPADGTVVRTRLQLRGFADTKTVRQPTSPGRSGTTPWQPPPQPSSSPSPSLMQQSSGAAGGQKPTPPPPPPPPLPPPPPPPPPSPVPSGRALDKFEQVQLESLAVIDVSYKRDERLGLWLPSKMSELYEGAIPRGGGALPFLGRATSVATYSNFRRFETAVKITFPK